MSRLKKSGLGRGLGALLEGVDIAAPVSAQENSAATRTPADGASDSGSNAGSVSQVPLDTITRGIYQPRVHFDETALQELADSISAQGLIQPVLLRKRGGGYELIAGERRWRAAKLAGLDEIPAIVREMDDNAVAAVTLIENIQREDLNPLEEARALQRLKDEFKMTHQAVADAVGRSRAAVTNLMRLLELDERVATMLAEGKLEMGHARALLSLDAADQHILAMKVYAEGLSVRATEKMVRDGLHGKSAAKKKVSAANATHNSHIKALESELSDKLGARVNINHGANSKGSVTIGYNSLDELDGILSHIH